MKETVIRHAVPAFVGCGIGALLAIADAPFWIFLPVIIAVGVVGECLDRLKGQGMRKAWKAQPGLKEAAEEPERREKAEVN